MSLIDEVFDFVKDQTLSFSKKSLIISGIIILIFMIDFCLGISFNYSINQKLNQIEKIEMIKTNFPINDTLLTNLNTIESKLLNRFDYVKIIHFHQAKMRREIYNRPDTIKKIQKDGVKQIQDTAKVSLDHEIKTTKTIKELKLRNWIWDLISSSYVYLLAVLFLIIMPFTQKSSFLKLLLGAFIMIVALGVVCWLTFLIFSNIPTILRPWINYVINAIVHLFIVGVVINTISKAGKK